MTETTRIQIKHRFSGAAGVRRRAAQRPQAEAA